LEKVMARFIIFMGFGSRGTACRARPHDYLIRFRIQDDTLYEPTKGQTQGPAPTKHVTFIIPLCNQSVTKDGVPVGAGFKPAR